MGSALGVDQSLGQSVAYYNPDTRPSYSRRYTVGLQQRLPAGMALEASYQYNQARGLPELWYATSAEGARHWLATFPAATHLKLEPSIWRDYPGSLS